MKTRLVFLVGMAGLAVGGGCGADEAARTNEERLPTLTERVTAFRDALSRGEHDTARALLAPGARRWWETREGDGDPWTTGPSGTGPWAGWDEHFGSEGVVVDWIESDSSVTVVVRETNDYFRLLERGSVTNELTYFFDPQDRIAGLLIRGVGERPPGRTEEFLTWAEINEPATLSELMPGGEIDPSGDHPERFRLLLERWRASSGLGPIDLAQPPVPAGRRKRDVSHSSDPDE